MGRSIRYSIRPDWALILLNSITKTLCSDGGGAFDNPALTAAGAMEMQGIGESVQFLQLVEASGALKVVKLDVEIRGAIQIVSKRDDVHGTSPVRKWMSQ